ncbi:MAG: PDZ domain-containing protein [Acidimicrobiia bacterium]|nr:PDZ domain-containing protein [Acidimicrobiia bacterium]
MLSTMIALDLTVTSKTVSDMSIDTTTTTSSVSPTVAGEQETVIAPRQRNMWWALPLLTIVWLVTGALITSSFVKMNYWEVAPGSAEEVASRFSFDKNALSQVTRYETSAPILFVTAYGSKLSALDSLVGVLDPDVDVLNREEKFGTISPSEQRRLGFQAMASAKQIAEYVALNRLGYNVSIAYGKLIIERLVCEDAPRPLSACLQLNPGDTITAFDGIEIPTLSDLMPIIADYSPGDVVDLTVTPHKTTESVTKKIELMVSPDDPNRTIIGVWPADTRTVDLPFEVDIDTDSIGGPSAGLSFTLALLDELTAGELTGGVKVAATGTIDGDESIGAIGALRQKTVAVKASGATVFLVPSAQTPEELSAARRVAGSKLRIVPVANLTEALKVLEELGGTVISNDAIEL